MKRVLFFGTMLLVAAMMMTACGGKGDVYVAGWLKDADGKQEATLWKNGVAQTLPGEGRQGEAHAVFVSGKDVYVVGRSGFVSTFSAMLWKNGVAHKITDGKKNDHAKSVYVSGKDVYIVGYAADVNDGGTLKAMLWKNNQEQRLSEYWSHANGVFVSGNDVYIVGFDRGSDDRQKATLWKNGVAQVLSDSHSEATSVYVSGNDVYVVGRSRIGATLWKNGEAQKLEDMDPYAVHVSGSNVYIAGTYIGLTTVAKQLINSEVKELNDKNATKEYAFDIYPSGKDVYIAGYADISNGNNIAKLWVNGVAKNLTDGSRAAQATSVFVK